MRLISGSMLAILAMVVGYGTSCAAPGGRSDRETLLSDAATVITMDPSQGEGPLGIVRNADVLIAGSRIQGVGKGLVAPNANKINAAGMIVLPGFVDVHNHIWQTIIRGCGADQELLGWLQQCVFPLSEAGITREEAFAVTRLGTLDLIASGVTTVVEFSHGFTPEFAAGDLAALQESGLRFAFAQCGGADRYDELRQRKKEVDMITLGSFQVCSHPSRKMQAELDSAAKLARELGVFLNVHLSESGAQLADDPMEALSLAGAFRGKLIVDHAIHLSSKEIGVLARSGPRVAHNPASNMRLASGIFPMATMVAEGVKIGLGLDGGTNDTGNMFSNMRAAVGLQRAVHRSPSFSPTVVEVLRMATLGGAEVLGIEDRTGSLTPGKEADIIVLDPRRANFYPVLDPLSQIVFSGEPENVAYVFVAGKLLKDAGMVQYSDVHGLLQATQRAAERIRPWIRTGERAQDDSRKLADGK